MSVKCIGCLDLERQVMGGVTVFYCEKFPYPCSASGLLTPGQGISQAAKSCDKDPLSGCVICGDKYIIHYGGDIVSICPYHDQEWGTWLKKHPARYLYLAPKGHAIRDNWVEVFREFVDDMKSVAVRRKS